MLPENRDTGNLMELAKYRLEVAKEDLETAEDNLSKNHFRAANNRAYYAIYHAITSVLSLEEIAFKKHKDTIAYFNKEYVRTEIFPKSLGRQISIAQEVRHASDYDEFYIASKSETLRQIACAKELLNCVQLYLTAKENVMDSGIL